MLFDAGEGCTFSLLRQRVDPNSISHVFLSHMHCDHVTGFPLLVQTMYLEGRKGDLEVYLPSEAVTEMDRCMTMLYLLRQKLNFKINYHAIGSQDLYRGPSIKVRAYPNQHLLGYEKILENLSLPLRMESHCFGIEAFGTKTIFSGDVGCLEDLDVVVLNADLLICECMHVELGGLFEFLRQDRAKRVILTHVPADAEGRITKTLQRAKDNGMENIEVAYDGLAVEL